MRALGRALRQSPLLLAGVAMVGALVVVAALAPWLAPYKPRAITGRPFENSSVAHLLGTNESGADIFSRLIWGSRVTLAVAVCATAIILAIGVALGVTAGLRGGLADTSVMRITDVFLAVPMLPVLFVVVFLVGPSLTLSIVLIGLTAWPQTARVVRSQTLTLRSRGFVDCARGFGASPLYVMRRHLLPALGPIIAANLVIMASVAVFIEASLAFLGLGDPAEVSWGAEIGQAVGSREINIGWLWLRWLVPAGVALSIAIVGFSLIGVALEPRFNPRWNRAR